MSSEKKRRELAVEYARKKLCTVQENNDLCCLRIDGRLSPRLAKKAVDWAAGHRAATDEHRALREAVRALAWALTRERVKELCKQLAMPAEWEAAVVEVIDSEEES